MSRCSDFNYCLCLFRDGVRFPWTLIKIFFWESKLKIKLNPFFGIFADNKNCRFLTAKNTSTTFRSKDLEASWNSYFCLFVCLFICLFVCLFFCLSVCLFAYEPFSEAFIPKSFSLIVTLKISLHFSTTVFCHSSSSSKYTITICLYPIWGKWPYQGTVPSLPL